MRKGFTLVEVLISLSILGLLFGLGSVNFRDYARRQQLVSAARNLKGELRLVQIKASAGEKPSSCSSTNILSSYSFIIYANSYRIVANCSPGIIANIKTESLINGISMESNVNPILFKVLGQGTNISPVTPAVITLKQTGTNNEITVTVTAGGEIK